MSANEVVRRAKPVKYSMTIDGTLLYVSICKECGTEFSTIYKHQENCSKTCGGKIAAKRVRNAGHIEPVQGFPTRRPENVSAFLERFSNPDNRRTKSV